MANRHHSGVARIFAPLAIAFVVAGAAPAAAQVENEPTALQRMLGGLGLLELPKDPIEYRERAPLVVPPSTGLIAPQSVEDIATRNPDWPVDHDAKQNAPLTPAQKADQRAADYDFYYSGRPLAPNQLRSRSNKQSAGRTAPESLESSQRVLSPTQLGFKGWNFGKEKEKEVVFTGEPERRFLTDPPAGLLTPSADAPYGVVTTESRKPGASNLMDRMQGTADPASGR